MRSRVAWCFSLCLFAVLVRLQLPAQSHRASMFQGTKVSKGIPPLSAPSFAAAATYLSGGNGANSVAIAQLRGAGQPYDLVVTNWCAYTSCTTPGTDIGVLLGKGNGSFQTAVVYSSGGIFADAIAIADVNGDGIPDLVVADCGANTQNNCAGGSVGVLLGVGNGTFGTAIVTSLSPSGASSVAVADVNGDGKPDVIVGTGSDTAGLVGVLLGKGDGTFQPEVTYSSGGLSPLAVAVAELGNGKFDVVVANTWDPARTVSNVGVLVGNGDGTFQKAVVYGTGGFFPDSVALADVNGDGKPDMVVANSSVTSSSDSPGNVGVLLGNGDGAFATAKTYLSGAYGAASVAIADVNGDGTPDIVVANCSGNSGDCTIPPNGDIGVLLGNGNGTFQTAITLGSGGNSPFGVAVGDVNGDGKPDIVAANCISGTCGGGEGLVGVLLNTTLTPTATALTSSPNPSTFGQAVTFTATVTGRRGFYKGTPTGTVSFYDGTTNIGNSNLSGGVATLVTSTLAVGKHSMTATYNGDSNFTSSTSRVLYQVVRGAIVSLSPTSLNFGNQTVGIPSTPQVVTLTNTGNIDLTITSIQIDGTNSGDFAETNNCPTRLTPNAYCTVNVKFDPKTKGVQKASVSVKDNAPDSPQRVSLTGTGTFVLLTPTELNFGTQAVGTRSLAKKITLTNKGNAAISITSIAITGTNSGDFAETNNCGKQVASGASCFIKVTFKPLTKGGRTADVSVYDNGGGSPQQVGLTGTGT